MANLPDIIIADVGIIAFWNAHDHRVNGASIDPTDCIPTFSTYTVYDNGIDGKIDPSAKGWGGSDRQINVRVKNDGWIVAWIDRTNTFFYPDKARADFGESGDKGYYDILWDWFAYNTALSDTYTTLSYMVFKLYDTLSNKGQFTFTASDVGHYCYEFTNANVLTLLHEKQGTGKFQYTTGTTIYHASGAGNGETSSTAGVTLTSVSYEIDYVGAADILSTLSTPLTDYNVVGMGWSSRTGQSAVLLIWR